MVRKSSWYLSVKMMPWSGRKNMLVSQYVQTRSLRLVVKKIAEILRRFLSALQLEMSQKFYRT